VCVCVSSQHDKVLKTKTKRHTLQFNFKIHKIQKRSFGTLVTILGLVGINFWTYQQGPPIVYFKKLSYQHGLDIVCFIKKIVNQHGLDIVCFIKKIVNQHGPGIGYILKSFILAWSPYWVQDRVFGQYKADKISPLVYWKWCKIGVQGSYYYLRSYPFGKVLAISVDTRSKPIYQTDIGSCVWWILPRFLPKIFLHWILAVATNIQLLLQFVMVFLHGVDWHLVLCPIFHVSSKICSC